MLLVVRVLGLTFPKPADVTGVAPKDPVKKRSRIMFVQTRKKLMRPKNAHIDIQHIWIHLDLYRYF